MGRPWAVAPTTVISDEGLASTTVVTNPGARPRASGSGTASRMPDGHAATATIPAPRRPRATGPRAAAPSGGAPPATTGGSAPVPPPCLFWGPPGELPDDRQDRVGQQAEGDVAIPPGPAPHLVVGQADLLLGRL